MIYDSEKESFLPVLGSFMKEIVSVMVKNPTVEEKDTE